MNIVQEQKIKELKCKIADTNNGVDIYKHELKHLDAQFISMLKLKEADRYIIQNDYRSANVCLSEAIELYKDNYAAYYMRAYVNYENRNYDKVINDCTLMINKNYSVDMLTVYWMRADAYEKMGENVLAIDDYSKMIRLNPQYENIYIVRGMCFVKEREYIKAMNDFNEQIKMDPNSGIAYFARGLLHKILGNYNLAKKDFDDAERLGYTGPL